MNKKAIIEIMKGDEELGLYGNPKVYIVTHKDDYGRTLIYEKCFNSKKNAQDHINQHYYLSNNRTAQILEIEFY